MHAVLKQFIREDVLKSNHKDLNKSLSPLGDSVFNKFFRRQKARGEKAS